MVYNSGGCAASDDLLSHSGVKGQKWGVRNGPPYPIEDKIMPKGTRLNTVSIIKNSNKNKNRGRMVYTYNPNDKWDSAVYKGPFCKFLTCLAYNKIQKKIYEHQYETVSDLKMPNKKERFDEFKAVLNKNKNINISELKAIQTRLSEYNIGEGSRDVSVDLDNLKNVADYKKAYTIFNYMMENAHAFTLTKSYVEIMSSKYDAMVDDNNQGVYNDVHDPVIIFNANKALKKVAKANLLSKNEIINNYWDVADVLELEGKTVKL